MEVETATETGAQLETNDLESPATTRLDQLAKARRELVEYLRQLSEETWRGP
jgi:hypothetical protein